MKSQYLMGRNESLRKAKGTIPHWKIAERLGVSEMTLTRWFRTEMSEERSAKILKIISDIRHNRSTIQ